jgi:ABC-type uncharacterized transport system involved in gliding motility auxiliary subunit
VDAALAIGAITTPAVINYEPHEITNGMPQAICAFPFSRPVTVASPAPAGVVTQPLVRTSTNSWVETDPNKVQYDGRDTKGPIILAATATKDLSPSPPAGADASAAPRKMARLALFGSSDLASDYYAGSDQIANPFLVLNTINWLAEEDALVSIPPKDDQPENVMLSDSQRRGLAIVNFILFPALATLAGLFTWWKRR